MALTRSFKATVQERALTDTKFRLSLLQESIECMISGDVDTGKTLLRDYINATIGFQVLGDRIKKSPKSLMRMLSPTGNPTAKNLFQLVQILKEQEGIDFQVEFTTHHTAS